VAFIVSGASFARATASPDAVVTITLPFDGGSAALPRDARGLVFRIYDAPSGGTLLAGPFAPSRVTARGERSLVTFGPVPPRVFEVDRRWLDVSSGTTTFPRVELQVASYDHSEDGRALTGGRTLGVRERATVSPEGVTRAMSNVVKVVDNGPPENRFDLVLLGDGYTADQLGLYASRVAQMVPGLFTWEPYTRYARYFNIYRVDVVSNESGVDGDPTCDILRDTALDFSLPCGTQWITFNSDKAWQQAAAAPAADRILILGNTRYGGGFSWYGGVSGMGGDPYYPGLALHELGHGIASLADEYFEVNAHYSWGEPVEPNVSVYDATTMAQLGTKWSRWLGASDPAFDGPVGTYEGGKYAGTGIYRPSPLSKMRSVDQPFNLPSVEQLLFQLYHYVRPIDDATPPGTLLDQYTTAFVRPLRLTDSRLAVEWRIDGTSIPGATEETFDPARYNLPIGPHTLTAVVTDTTSWVRDEAMRSAWMSDSRSWAIEIGDRSPRITMPAEVQTDEGALLSLTIGVADPDGDPVTSLTAIGSAIDAGATFTPDATHSSALLAWTPDFTRAGTYEVYVTASNILTRTAMMIISVRNVNRVPVVTAPATARAAENSLLTIDVSATDPDLERVSLSASAVSENAWFEDHGDNRGMLGWYVDFEEAGEYLVRFTGTDVLGGSGGAETRITIDNTDRAPIVSAPGQATVTEGERLTFVVTAADPDGEAIDRMSASPLPPGASFIVDPPGAGTFDWTPGFADAGVHRVEFRASNALEAVAAVDIRVGDLPRPPVVTAPAHVTGAEGAPLGFDVGASDPDGEPIDSLSADPLPPGAEFTPNASRTSGHFAWTPDFSRAGSYGVVLSAKSACRAEGVSGPVPAECQIGTASVTIEIANTDRPPLVACPPSVAGAEGALIEFVVSAADPDGEAVPSIQASGLPLGATFEQGPDPSSRAFRWTPGYDQAGAYTVLFSASNALVGQGTTEIAVEEFNRAPVSDPGGPYAGVAGVAIEMDGSGSYDPDGGPITFEWDFGDGSAAAGSSPSHAYAHGGAFEVRLTVRDAGPASIAALGTTTATVAQALEADLFTTRSDGTIRLESAKPTWCVRVEPKASDFRVEEVDLASLLLRYGETEIAALAGKGGEFGDQDMDGIPDIGACFGKPDLRTAFASLPSGRATVTVDVEGALVSGARIRGTVSVDVVAKTGDVTASLAPNPMVSKGTLTFSIVTPGRTRVSLFDLHGRLVRVVRDEAWTRTGYHDVPVDGSSSREKGLPSGIYFYRVESRDGIAVGRFAVIH
jgi:PKD repeat protein